jgi:hypothetical protein
MFNGIFNGAVVGLWQDNGILPNNTAKDLGKSSVSVYLTDGETSVTLEVHDNDVLAILSELDFVAAWADEDARKPCEIRRMLQ